MFPGLTLVLAITSPARGSRVNLMLFSYSHFGPTAPLGSIALSLPRFVIGPGNCIWNSHHARFAARPGDEPPKRQNARKNQGLTGVGRRIGTIAALATWRGLGNLAKPWQPGGSTGSHSRIADYLIAPRQFRTDGPVKGIPNAIALSLPRFVLVLSITCFGATKYWLRDGHLWGSCADRVAIAGSAACASP
jgi:hypothetical protein